MTEILALAMPVETSMNRDLLSNASGTVTHETLQSPPTVYDSGADALFLKENSKGWIHGVRTPYTVFDYNPLTCFSTKNRLKKTNDDGIVEASIVLDKVRHSAFGRDEPSTDHSLTINLDEIDSKIAHTDTSQSAFAGYCSIPRMTVNFPQNKSSQKTKASSSGVAKFCYQNLYDNGEDSYLFGGLGISEATSLEHLGIPCGVDPSKISVYFPCELPPFVSREIISNPLMSSNKTIYLFNPLRGTLTYLGKLTGESAPQGIHSLVNCRVSRNHVFFYGGFSVITDSVNYDSALDRWIIKKRIELNKHGFLFDIVTLRFVKFDLRSKDDESIEIGRIGACVTSSVFEQADKLDLPARAPSPPIFSDNNKEKPENAELRLPEYNAESFASIQSVSSSGSPVSNRSANSTGAGLAPVKSNTPCNTPITASNTVPEEFATPTHTQSYPSRHVKKSKSKSGSSNTDRTSPSSLIKSFSNGGNSPQSTQGSSSSSSTSSTKQSKMSSVLSKSSRIFHRHNKVQTLQQQVSSQQASNLQQQAQLSQANQSAPKSAPSLMNSYSKQVHQHRTKLTLDPAAQPKSKADPRHEYATGNQNVEISAPSPLKPNRPPPPALINQVLNGKGVQSIASPSGSPTSSPSSLDGSTAISEASSAKSLHTGTNSSDSKDSEAPDAYSPEDNVNIEPVVGADNVLFDDSILKSGINSVAIFVFGGFYSVEDSEGFQTFVASDDLLKINLSCKDEGNIVTFHTDAVVYSMKEDLLKQTNGSEKVWPAPRGYFASAIIERKTDQVNCAIEGVHLYTGPSESIGPVPKGNKKKGTTADFFSSKSMVVQGGCNSDRETFSDFYMFHFETGQWESFDTYCYDYFENQIDPDEDEDVSKLSKKNEVADAQLIEAELRSCHHTALYYESFDQHYLFFLGGLYNDYLRHFDTQPYKSDKFDVSRLSKFSFITENTNVSRIPVLNLQTQTWKFVRYYFDIRHSLTDKYIQRVNNDPKWVNARMANISGTVSLNGKTITICEGLSIPCPTKKKDIQEMSDDLPMDALLWGAHIHFNFPSI